MSSTIYIRNESNHTVFARIDREGGNQSDNWFEIRPRGTEYWKRDEPRIHLNTTPDSDGEEILELPTGYTYIYTGWEPPYLITDEEWRETKADAAGPGEQRAAQPAQRGEQEEVDEEGHQMF